MTTPPLKLEQVGRKWRVVREDVPEKWSAITVPLSKKEAEWFMRQLQEPTEDAIEEWVDIRIESEQEDKERMYEVHRPHKRKWIRKARAEGRVKPPIVPPMTKKRYERLLKRAAEEEGDGGVLERG